MIRIRISPSAQTAIVKQFKLLELSEPGIYLFREPPVADLSRTESGDAMWNVERSQRCYLQFGELAPPASNANRVQIVEGIRIWALRFCDTEQFEIEITTDNCHLFVDMFPLDDTGQPSKSSDRSTPRQNSRNELQLGLIPGREIVDSTGNNRLSLFTISVGVGQDFHSLLWECGGVDSWRERLKITRKQFQGAHPYRRWVAKLHAFTPSTGVAIVQVAEGDRLIEDIAACNFLYSWRAWDLQKNVEVRRLKDCTDPFEPLY